MVYEVHDLEMNVVPLYFPGQDGQSEVMKHDAYQHQAASYASLVRVMSKFDFDIMSETWEDYDSNTFVWLPVAAAAAESDFTLDKERTTLSYIGNMSYKPNYEGAEAIVDMAPSLPDYDWCFVGRGSEEFDSSEIRGLGMVDDISPILRKTAIGLAPIFSGSGMKIKNLMYLKHGIPVLTTSVGAQGYPKSEAIIVEDDLSRWPLLIGTLAADAKRLVALSRTASEVFRRNFESAHVDNRAMMLYQHCIKNYHGSKKRVMPSIDQSQIDPHEMYWVREFRESLTSCVTEITVLRPEQQQLVVLEGLPGSGKSLLISKFAENTRARIVPEIMHHIDYTSALPYIDHDLKKYASSQYHGITIMDRGVDSTLAVESHHPTSEMYRASREATELAYQKGELRKPNAVVYLDISIDLSLDRQNAWNNPMWLDRGLLSSVEAYYNKTYRDRSDVIVIDGTQSADDVYASALVALRKAGIRI